MTAREASPRQLLSRNEGIEILGLGLTTYKALVRTGELREIRVGSRALLPRSEVERFIADRLARLA
jgi:excisionase family DNA binding protein